MHKYRLTIHITSKEELEPVDLFPREATRDYLEAVLGDIPAQYTVSLVKADDNRQIKGAGGISEKDNILLERYFR